MKRDYDDAVYKRFRLEVLKRDSFTCKMCKARVKKTRLNVHHIMKWSSAASLRYDVDNGITLCRKCHDSIKGKETHYISYFLDLIQKG